MRDLDDLIERLLVEIALCGTHGLTVAQLEIATQRFLNYDRATTAADNGDQTADNALFSASPPAHTAVDDNFLEVVHDWLSHHPDVEVQDRSEAGEVGSGLDLDRPAASVFVTKHSGKRFFTTEDRMWHAITGHGVDHKLVPAKEFELLCIIAAYGPDGILQPSVTHISGQDKRSVPKRTDVLAKKGYIIKDYVAGFGTRTSFLKLKRYDDEHSNPQTQSELGSTDFRKSFVHYNTWFDGIIGLLKENGAPLALSDLRAHLNIDSNSQEVTLLCRCINRLAEAGCVQRVSGKNKDPGGKDLTVDIVERPRSAQCLRLLREPTELDRVKFRQTCTSEDNIDREDGRQAEGEDGEDDDAAVSGDEGELVDVRDGLNDLDLLQDRTPPSWTPAIPITNQIYELVNNAGQKGIITFDLASRLVGPVFRRPFDEATLRLTSIGKHSQPPHLKHLAIVRDTVVRGRSTLSRYRTQPNFEKAVKAGEAVVDVSNEFRVLGRPPKHSSDLDKWGFPRVSPKESASNGTTTRSPGAENVQRLPSTAQKKRRQKENTLTSQQPLPNTQQSHELSVSTLQTPPKKKRGPYRARDPSKRPSAPASRKRELPEEEVEAYDAIAQAAAERKVMFEVNDSRKRAADEAGMETFSDEPRKVAKLTPERGTVRMFTLPQDREDRVAQVKSDIIARSKPGIYINPPGARSLKIENFIRRGRPRKMLIAVVKSPRLEELPWFQHEAPRFAPRLSNSRTRLVEDHTEGPPRKRLHYTSQEQSQSRTATSNLSLPATIDLPHTTSGIAPADSSSGVSNAQQSQRVIFGEDPSGMADISVPSPGLQTKLSSSATQNSNQLDETSSAAHAIVSLPATTQARPQQDNFAKTLPNVGLVGTIAVQRAVSAQDDEHREVAPSIVSTQQSSKPSMNAGTAVTTPLASHESLQKFTTSDSLEVLQDESGRATSNNTSYQSALVATKSVPTSSLVMKTTVSAAIASASPPDPAVTERPPFSGQTSREPTTTPQASPAALELKALRSRPGRKTNATWQRIANLEKQIQTEKLSSKVTVFESSAVPPGPVDLPVTVGATVSNFTTNEQPHKVFDKAYVLAHPDEVFHHKGFGHYARGPKSVRPRASGEDVRLAAAKAAREALGTTTARTGLDEQGQWIDTGSDKLGHTAKMTTSAEHLGNILGDQPTDSRQRSTATTDPTPSVILFDQSDNFDAGATQLNENATTSDKPHDSTATGVQITYGPPVTPSTERFNALYVNQHPDETFYHRGHGQWIRGLPPSGSTHRTGVRGPGAKEWTASMMALFDATAQARKDIAKATPKRMPSGRKAARRVQITGTEPPSNDKNSHMPRTLELQSSSSIATRKSSDALDVSRPELSLAEEAVSGQVVAHGRGQILISSAQAESPRAAVNASSAVTQEASGKEQAFEEETVPNVAFDDARMTSLIQIDDPPSIVAEVVHPPLGKTTSSERRPELTIVRPYTNNTIVAPSPAKDPRTPRINIIRPYENVASSSSPIQDKVPQSLAVTANEEATLKPFNLQRATSRTALANDTLFGSPKDGHYDPVTMKSSVSVDVRLQSTTNVALNNSAVHIGDPAVTNSTTNVAPTDPSLAAAETLVQCQQIILDALRSCKGVFPGNTEPWHVSVAAWTRLQSQIPEREAVDDVIRHMVELRLLKRLTFQFRSKKGIAVRRHILAESDVDPYSAVVKDLQKNIIHSYPAPYFPAEADVSAEVREKFAKAPEHEAAHNVVVTTAPPAGPEIVRYGALAVQQAPAVAAAEDNKTRQLGTITRRAWDAACEYKAQQHKRMKRRWYKRPADFETDDDDDGIDVHPGQAAMQTELQVNGYRHDVSLAQQPRRRSNGQVSKRVRFNDTDIPPEPKPPTSARGRVARPMSALRMSSAHRRSRDVDGGMTLDDIARHRRQAASLLLHPDQSLHEPTGTFSTAGLVEVEELLDQRASRSRSQLDALSDLHESTSQQDDQPDDQPSADQNELKDDEAHSSSYSSTPVAVVKLKVPSLMSLDLSTTSEGSQSAGKLKRPYKSRKQLASQPTDDAARDSDNDYIPSLDPSQGAKAQYAASVVARRAITGRDRRSPAMFKDDDRLVVAMALVHAVCGGINQDRLSWALIAHALSFRYDPEFLRRRWSSLRKHRKPEVESFRDGLREPFLQAYEQGELPAIDFANLNSTDWPAMFNWAEYTVGILKKQEGPEVPQLYQTRAVTEERYDLQEAGPLFELTRDDFFSCPTDMNRKHLVLRYHHGSALPGRAKPTNDFTDQLLLAKSWVRAVAMTKTANYNTYTAANKVRHLGEDELSEATNEMLKNKMFLQERKNRQRPGRNYDIHNDVVNPFRRWPARPQEYRFLRGVAQSWIAINNHFQLHDKMTLNPTIADQMYLVLTNLVAQGMLKVSSVLPDIHHDYDAPYPRLSPWGYGPPGYETKRVDSSVLKFPIVYTKSQLYQSHHSLQTGVPIPTQPSTVPGEIGPRIPFWVDIYGNLIDDVWDMVLRSMLHLLVYRPGCTAEYIEKAHNHRFWAWEIEMVLEWMGKVGLARRSGEGIETADGWKGGWGAGAWWFCAFIPEIATWKEPRDGDVGGPQRRDG